MPLRPRSMAGRARLRRRRFHGRDSGLDERRGVFTRFRDREFQQSEQARNLLHRRHRTDHPITKRQNRALLREPLAQGPIIWCCPIRPTPAWIFFFLTVINGYTEPAAPQRNAVPHFQLRARGVSTRTHNTHPSLWSMARRFRYSQKAFATISLGPLTFRSPLLRAPTDGRRNWSSMRLASIRTWFESNNTAFRFAAHPLLRIN